MQTASTPRFAKTALIGLGALATGTAAFTATAALAAITSNVYIEPRETFVLGGAQPGAFNVSGQNKGDVRVEVYARDAEGDTLITTIAPGDRFKADFAKGEGALLRNTSTGEKAHVRVRITGTTSNLGMRYQGW